MDEFKIGVIYMYTSPSGKKYIGQTIREMKRKSQHKSETSKSQTHFGKAIRKYGWENFKYEVLLRFRPTEHKLKLKRVLDKLEKRYVKLHKSYDREFGYNLNKGGEGNIGYAHSEESKEKIGEAAKVRMEDSEYKDKIIENLTNHEKSKSETTKEKLSNNCKTKKQVYQYNDKLEVINTFSSISDAAKSITNDATHKTKSNRISECISGKLQSSYGFIWRRD